MSFCVELASSIMKVTYFIILSLFPSQITSSRMSPFMGNAMDTYIGTHITWQAAYNYLHIDTLKLFVCRLQLISRLLPRPNRPTESIKQSSSSAIRNVTVSFSTFSYDRWYLSVVNVFVSHTRIQFRSQSDRYNRSICLGCLWLFVRFFC